uniref:Uncharacterized protein n=1 Tax=Kalanchoe fedtschenkoi TaxID=63787 RepID=A0A7N1A409_KALFE
MIVEKERRVKETAREYGVFRRVGHLGLMKNLVLLQRNSCFFFSYLWFISC